MNDEVKFSCTLVLQPTTLPAIILDFHLVCRCNDGWRYYRKYDMIYECVSLKGPHEWVSYRNKSAEAFRDRISSASRRSTF